MSRFLIRLSIITVGDGRASNVLQP